MSATPAEVETGAEPTAGARTHKYRKSAPTPPVKLRPTILGWLVACEALMLLSTVYWQPRPYALVLGVALAAAVVAAALLASRQLADVEFSWELPGKTHAGDEVAVPIALRSPRGTLPVEMLGLAPGKNRYDPISRFAALGKNASRCQWTVRFNARGLATIVSPVLTSIQPFGLFRSSRKVGADAEVLVLPTLGLVRRELRNRLSTWLEQTAIGMQAGDDEIAHLRDYRPGDARHSIHWRASARCQKLLVADRHATTCRHLALVVDSALNGASLKKLDRLASVAATLLDFLARQGWQISLHGAVAPNGVHGPVDVLMGHLAVLQPSNEAVADFIPSHRTVLVLSLGAVELPPMMPQPYLLTLPQCDDLVRLPGQGR